GRRNGHAGSAAAGKRARTGRRNPRSRDEAARGVGGTPSAMEGEGLRENGFAMNGVGADDGASAAVIAELGFAVEMEALRRQIADWIRECNDEMRAALEWQFLAGSKYFRPLTIFSCYRALHRGPVPAQVMTSAMVVELFHNVALVIDDI